MMAWGVAILWWHFVEEVTGLQHHNPTGNGLNFYFFDSKWAHIHTTKLNCSHATLTHSLISCIWSKWKQHTKTVIIIAFATLKLYYSHLVGPHTAPSAPIPFICERNKNFLLRLIEFGVENHLDEKSKTVSKKLSRTRKFNENRRRMRWDGENRL